MTKPNAVRIECKRSKVEGFWYSYYLVSTRTGNVTNSPEIFFAIQDDAIPQEVRERFEIVKGSYPGFLFSAENATAIDKRCSRKILPIRGLENLDQLNLLEPQTRMDQAIVGFNYTSGVDRLLFHHSSTYAWERRKELGEEVKLEVGLPSDEIVVEHVIRDLREYRQLPPRIGKVRLLDGNRSA